VQLIPVMMEKCDFGWDRDEMDKKIEFLDGIGRDGIFLGLYWNFSGLQNMFLFF
jgi:hypothetical protein